MIEITEKEKMLAAKQYFAGGEELSQERLAVKELLFDYNHSRPKEAARREELLGKILGGFKGALTIESPFYCDYGYNIFVGEHFFANYNFTVIDCNRVIIGDDVLIGPNVSLFTAGHPIDPGIRSEDVEFAEPIIIGNRVWIGGGSIINPNVKIGDNSVIGSGSVVTKDIPENVVAAGNPCRVLRPITEDDLMKFNQVY